MTAPRTDPPTPEEQTPYGRLGAAWSAQNRDRAALRKAARPDLTAALRIALDRLDAYIDATDDETVGDGDTDEDRAFVREVREVLGPPPVLYPRGYDHRVMCSRTHPVTYPCDEAALAALLSAPDQETRDEVMTFVPAWVRDALDFWYLHPGIEAADDLRSAIADWYRDNGEPDHD